MIAAESKQNKTKITKVTSFAAINECQLTKDKSLHSLIEINPGEIISEFGSKEVLDTPNYLTVQISDSEHIMLAPEFLQYINHSCSPNVFFDTTNMVVMALQKIEIGEEFTFFYPSTEWSMDQGFDCLCQSENCLEYIQGAAHLPPEILRKYKLSQYIEQKLEN
ncbi:MAG: SET domain-containing protein [Okeania sp. SIO2F4]|uniref:SET domain-containing protein-lysine N-methyltransferase n=1 Tax=Okeania sp. SIO2F4 TaxID=2607790 RepID=UPI00142C861B|nr:SET domain-containing protein-lysine N-methyltransferase [Okeania sp. SIO2F4]NES04652.1 SET domain-containing protein [Okeania sp. SIO2F4]